MDLLLAHDHHPPLLLKTKGNKNSMAALLQAPLAAAAS
jgi:hypothetical protein